jgi:hypothetical protein
MISGDKIFQTDSHSFILSFDKYLLSACYAPGNILMENAPFTEKYRHSEMLLF